jgi:hypothetical protein
MGRPHLEDGVLQNTLDFATIAREAVASLPAILRRLLPGGRVIGREYIALNPTRIDHRTGSFKVHLTGSRAGAWADIATGDRGGDVISLVAYLGHRVTLRKRSANRGGWEIIDLDANPEKGGASRLEALGKERPQKSCQGLLRSSEVADTRPPVRERLTPPPSLHPINE